MKRKHKKPKKAKHENGGEPKGPLELSTISIAVPGSILENAQSPELRSYLAGQVARAACIFQADEVVIFDDIGVKNTSSTAGTTQIDDDGDKRVRRCASQFAKILQYLECPQYLRKTFFPMHKDLQYSGLLNPLDSQHHLRQTNDFLYREGVTVNKKVKEGSQTCFVNVGLLHDVKVNQKLEENLRVTVKMDPGQDLKAKKLHGTIVPPTEPRRETGIYWGYSVRIASSLTEIFTKSPYEGGYDLTIGTSDKGDLVSSLENNSLEFHHALIVFGGLQGLESALESDDKLEIDDPSLLFDHYLNTVPRQGSRTVRTEEAILISLAALEEKWKPKVKCKDFKNSESIAQSEDTGVKMGPLAKKQKME